MSERPYYRRKRRRAEAYLWYSLRVLWIGSALYLIGTLILQAIGIIQ